MTIDGGSVVRRRPDILGADVGGEFVLMSIERGKYFGLDEIGSYIWRQIEQPMEVATLCRQLVEEYDAALDTIEHDVLTLLRQLDEHGLLAPVA